MADSVEQPTPPDEPEPSPVDRWLDRMRGYHCFPQDTVRALSAHIVGQPEAIDVITVQIRQ